MYPKFVFDIMDGIARKTGMSVYFWSGGLDHNGKVVALRYVQLSYFDVTTLLTSEDYREEWYDVKDKHALAFLESKEYKAVDIGFKGYLAKRHSGTTSRFILFVSYSTFFSSCAGRNCHAPTFSTQDCQFRSKECAIAHACPRH